MSGRLWTKAEDARIRALAATCNSTAIAAVLDRTSDAVKHRARRIGVSLKKCGDNAPNVKYSDALIEAARQLHDQGYGPRWIASRLNINEWTLRSALYYRQRTRPAQPASIERAA